MNISYSRVSSYMSCPYSHYLRYVERVSPKKPARPLFFGSDFHKLLEFRKDKTLLKKALNEIKAKYYELPSPHKIVLGDDYIDVLKEIFSDYRKVYKGCPLPDVTEQRFELPMGRYHGEQINFIGVIDELYKSTKEIGEHKTFSQKPNINTLIMNTQKCLYAKATQLITGELPHGVIWDYIKSEPSKFPIWLEKSQKFSEAKSESITPMSWKRACLARGIDDEEIIAIGEKYRPNIQNFFFRVPMEFGFQMINNVWEDFKYTSLHIVKFGCNNKAKNMTRNCSWCDFQPICYAEMTGGDREHTIDMEFIRKE